MSNSPTTSPSADDGEVVDVAYGNPQFFQRGGSDRLALKRPNGLTCVLHGTRFVWRDVRRAVAYVHPEDIALLVLARAVASTEPLHHRCPRREFSYQCPRRYVHARLNGLGRHDDHSGAGWIRLLRDGLALLLQIVLAEA